MASRNRTWRLRLCLVGEKFIKVFVHKVRGRWAGELGGLQVQWVGGNLTGSHVGRVAWRVLASLLGSRVERRFLETLCSAEWLSIWTQGSN